MNFRIVVPIAFLLASIIACKEEPQINRITGDFPHACIQAPTEKIYKNIIYPFTSCTENASDLIWMGIGDVEVYYGDEIGDNGNFSFPSEGKPKIVLSAEIDDEWYYDTLEVNVAEYNYVKAVELLDSESYILQSAIMTKDGGFLLNYFSYPVDNNYGRQSKVKFNSDGNIEWNYITTQTYYNNGKSSIVELPNGNFFTIDSYAPNGGQLGSYKIFSAMGELISEEVIPVSNDYTDKVFTTILIEENTLRLFGYYKENKNSNKIVYIRRVDFNGNFVEEAYVSSLLNIIPYAVTKLNDEYLLASGKHFEDFSSKLVVHKLSIDNQTSLIGEFEHVSSFSLDQYTSVNWKIAEVNDVIEVWAFPYVYEIAIGGSIIEKIEIGEGWYLQPLGNILKVPNGYLVAGGNNIIGYNNGWEKVWKKEFLDGFTRQILEGQSGIHFLVKTKIVNPESSLFSYQRIEVMKINEGGEIIEF